MPIVASRGDQFAVLTIERDGARDDIAQSDARALPITGAGDRA